MPIVLTKLPNYFRDINHPKRWVDEFADNAPSIIQPQDLDLGHARAKHARNEAYSKWLAAFFYRTPDGIKSAISGKKMIWQAVRVVSFKHSESGPNDWWEKYQDCAFRVFVQPETIVDRATGDHKQWYLLSPEDGYLVNLHEAELLGRKFEPRDFNGREKFLSAEKILRCARLIPVECCKHLRHETTGGVLPIGL